MQPSKIDIIYAIIGVIIGLVMIASPRTFMYKAKYDEESLKTESWTKKLGIALTILSIGFGIYIIVK